jgi:hypothetical protein
MYPSKKIERIKLKLYDEKIFFMQNINSGNPYQKWRTHAIFFFTICKDTAAGINKLL